MRSDPGKKKACAVEIRFRKTNIGCERANATTLRENKLGWREATYARFRGRRWELARRARARKPACGWAFMRLSSLMSISLFLGRGATGGSSSAGAATPAHVGHPARQVATQPFLIPAPISRGARIPARDRGAGSWLSRAAQQMVARREWEEGRATEPHRR